MKAAAKKMEQAEQELKANESPKKSQGDAVEKLKAAIQKLESMMQENVSKDDALAFDELREKQFALRKELDKLMQNDEVKKQESANSAMDSANRKMQEAENNLDQKRSGPAEKNEDEAKQKLDDAKAALEEKLNEYVQLQQEKMLLHMETELNKLKDRQEDAHKATEDVDVKVTARGRVTSELKREIGKIASAQAEIKKISESLIEALKTGSYPSFLRSMEWTDRDLEEINKLISGRDPDTGEYTRNLQQDVIKRISRLTEAVRRERERVSKQRKKPPGPPPKGPPPPAKLVKKLAELELMKLEQIEMNEKLNTLKQTSPNLKISELSENQRKVFERLSHREGELKTTWDTLSEEISKALGG